MLWSLAKKEVVRNSRFSLVFVINIAIGLLGLILIENFKVSFQSVLDQRAKNLLGSDIAMTSKFPFEKEKLKIFKDYFEDEIIAGTQILSMMSMGRAQVDDIDQSRLIQVNILDNSNTADRYPYYGHLGLESGEYYPNGNFRPLEKSEIWVYPEVIAQLGDGSIKIGNKVFDIADVVTDDASEAFGRGDIAPKVYMHLSEAKEAGLIQLGSTIRYKYYLKTKTSISDKQVEELVNKLDDNAIRIQTPKKASAQVGRTLAYLSDFLGLVSLVALFLASVGLMYLYLSHLSTKRISFAIYSSLGLSRKQIFGLYMRHIFILASTGAFVGVILSIVSIPLVNGLLQYVLPFALPSLISMKALFIGLCVGLLGVLLLSYPLILSALRLRAASLFQEVAQINFKLSDTQWYHFGGYFVFFCLMTLYAANSIKVGSIFLLLFFGVIIVGYIKCHYILKFLKNISHRFSFQTKLSWRYLYRYKVSTISIFMSLLLGCMLLNLIPMLQTSIESEVTLSREGELPSLFLFDIQDDQVTPIKNFFQEKNLELLSLSPLIRSRIKSINGREISVDSEKALTREEQRKQRFRNRGTSLSFRDELSKSETIIEGSKFPGPFNKKRDGIPLLSIEKRYAERLELSMGDIVVFDVLGMPVEGKVFNIRNVKWTSFLPNFFIQFQSGVLDDAPKSWLAAIESMDDNKLNKIQSQLFSHFSNISAIDVTRVVKKILEIMGQMAWALKAMSFLCLSVGLFVMYSLVSHQMNSRLKDLVLLKIVGMTRRNLQSIVVKEFVIIGVIAAIIGALSATGVSFIVGHIFFDGLWRFSWQIPTLSILVVSIICFVISTLAAKKTLNRPASVFLN